MPPSRIVARVLGACVLALAGAHAGAQSDGAGTKPDAEPTPPPPTVRLGLRVNALQQRLPVAPTVVIVPDAETYLAAIERWAPGASFPILIDDGSPDARENIARFVRAFVPESVVRWAPAEPVPPGGAGEPAGSRAERIEGAIARFWGAPSPAALDEHWARLGFEPPGVVVSSTEDGAWTAGVALAMDRGQPIIWTTPQRKLPRAGLEPDQLAMLERDLRNGLNAHNWPWATLGDAIDAVTLCLNTPTRIDPPAGEKGDFALTDRIGRHADGSRYAWAGVLFGDEAAAAYRAMCALFLAPDHGWVFDGYNGNYPDAFDAGLAIPLFERVGFDVVYTESEGANLPTWRARCRTGIDGGFVHVNSAGYPRWFEVVRRERAWASETPLLREPAVVHFIHSFSAKIVDHPESISGRWLENGAYAYVGAVDEPYLQGFLPAEKYFSRLFAGVPLGAAPRYDDASAWKIQVVGDPLIVAGRPRPRRAVEPPLPGAEPLEAIMKRAIEARRFAEGASALVMLGRDDDAIRFTRAALADAPGDADGAGLARAVILPAFRAGDHELFMDLFERLPPKEASRELYTSALWQILRPRLAGDPEPRIVNLLRANVRNDSVVDDAWDLRTPVARLYGREALESMVVTLIERTRNGKAKDRLREVMSSRPFD